MIKVNLALKKQPAAPQEATGLTSFTRIDLRSVQINKEILQGLPLRGILITLVVGIGGNVFVDQRIEEAMLELRTKSSAVDQRMTKLKTDYAKVKGYEVIKAQLDQDEFLLLNKIKTIRDLSAGRDLYPKMLIALSRATPPSSWLEGMKQANGKIEIIGSSSNLNEVSTLMSNLNSSAMFSGVSLTKTEEKESKEVGKVASFKIQAETSVDRLVVPALSQTSQGANAGSSPQGGR